MRLIRLFSSFSGRIGRRGFWFGMLALLVAGSAATVSVTPNILSEDPFSAVLKNLGKVGSRELAIYLALLIPGMALVVKRLHDRNKSGLFAALFWAPALLQGLIVALPGLAGVFDTLLWGVNWLGAWIGTIAFWFFVELGFFGAVEPNKYGGEAHQSR